MSDGAPRSGSLVSSEPTRAFDLFPKLSSYLDVHLIFHLLEFVRETGMYSEASVERQRLAMLSKTNMMDEAIDVYKQVHAVGDDAVPHDLVAKREKVWEALEEYGERCSALRALLAPPEPAANEEDEAAAEAEALAVEQHEAFTGLLRDEQEKEMPQPISLDTLARFGVTETDVNSLYVYSKLWYESGQSGDAAGYLKAYTTIMGTSSDSGFSALWGQLGSEIQMAQWDEAWETMKRLQEAIDNRSFEAPLHQLQQRSWLMHWGLFVFFNHQHGFSNIVDFFFQSNYMNAIQTNCPWMLRYLAVAVVINKRAHYCIRDLLRILKEERYAYSDPVTEFLEALYVDFSFERAEEKLNECGKLFASDFFLSAYREEFLEQARLFVFETYCRLHSKIDIGALAGRLALEREEAERWVVDLVRNAQIGAKIDSRDGHVVMGVQSSSVHKQVVEKTKDLSQRTYILGSSLERLRHDARQAYRSERSRFD